MFAWLKRFVPNVLLEATHVLNQMYGIEIDDDEEQEEQEQQKEQEQEQKEQQVKEVKYEDKYLDRFLTAQSGCVPVNSFVIEMTPVGNVIMQYNKEKESFVYYSDHIIPYRYLETVSRKYVCIFNCKQLFIERHEELVKEEKEKEEKEKEEKEKEPRRFNVLNQSQKQVPAKKEQREVKMNRYSNSGRFSNFATLQPVAKHITDKKRLMTFSEFKAFVKTSSLSS
jgi:hemolysin activation/secretion protein